MNARRVDPDGVGRGQGAGRSSARSKGEVTRAGRGVVPAAAPDGRDRARHRRRGGAHAVQDALAARQPRGLRPDSGTTRPTRRATIWLAQTLKKPLLKLTDEDYNEHGLQELIASRGGAYDINIEVFKTTAGDHHRLARRQAADARTADARSRLRDAGHVPARQPGDLPQARHRLQPAPGRRRDQHGRHVHPPVRPGARGARRLPDERQHRRLRRGRAAARRLRPRVRAGVRAWASSRPSGSRTRSRRFVRRKQPGEVDSPELQKIKGLIRRTEARAAARFSRREGGTTSTSSTCRSTRPAGCARSRSARRTSEIVDGSAGGGEAAPDLRRRRPVRPARHAPRLPGRDLRGGAGG